jgi:acyl carrier protein
MAIPEKLTEFINANREPLPPVTDPDEPLHMDSLAMMRLVSFLESDLGYTVEDEQLVLENFETLNAVSKMIEGKGVRIA